MGQRMEDDAPYELYQRAWAGKKDDEEITQSFMLARAKDIITEFNECGHEFHEKLVGNRGKEAQKKASQLKIEVEQFIKKYDLLPSSIIQLMKKDAPYELKERVIERVRSGEKLSPNFIVSQARKMIVEFCREGNEFYGDISGNNGEEAQNMANELKVSLEGFVKKYETNLKIGNVTSLTSDMVTELVPKGRIVQGAKKEKEHPEKLSLVSETFKETTYQNALLRSKTHPYQISP